MKLNAPYFSCMRCGGTSETELWDKFTREQYRGECKSISEGYRNMNLAFVCPCCGKTMLAPNIQEYWPDIGLDFYGRNE